MHKETLNKMPTMWRWPKFECKSAHCNSLRKIKIQIVISYKLESKDGKNRKELYSKIRFYCFWELKVHGN